MKISIIVPVYNAEKFLSECLDSCLDQAPFVLCKDYEIICINDGSTDDSLSILRKYESMGVTIIDQKNAGVSVARNIGLDSAKGEYVWFVDSDDIIRPNILSPIYNEVIRCNADGCTLKVRVVEESYKLSNTNDETSFTFNRSITNMQNVFMIITKRSYINDHNIRFKEKMSYGEDTLFVYYLRLYGHNFINCPHVLYYYRQVSSSAMHQKNSSAVDKSLNSSLIMLEEFKNVLDNWDDKLFVGDAMTQERYFWTVQNILFTLLRIDKTRRKKIFEQLQNEGHYPYPIQLKRLLVDSKCLKAYFINGFCLFFPIKLYYKLVCILWGK